MLQLRTLLDVSCACPDACLSSLPPFLRRPPPLLLLLLALLASRVR
jgi:hypothetical protein